MNKGSKKVVVDKNDLRRLMKEKSSTSSLNQGKIESPYAKYNAVGHLWCTLCNRQVKNNLLWNAHVQSRSHKELVKSGAESFVLTGSAASLTAKRKASDVDESAGPEKKLPRGESGVTLVSGSSSVSSSHSKPLSTSIKLVSVDESDEEMSEDGDDNSRQAVASSSNQLASRLPSDFFDDRVQQKPDVSNEIVTTVAEQLPEGFFDDPVQDAKARQVPYKDKLDEEWELFQKTMKEEALVSEALEEEDDELREAERNIEEIDDQLCRWSRVTSLLKKREQFSCAVSELTISADQVNAESEPDDDFDEFSDWRAGGK